MPSSPLSVGVQDTRELQRVAAIPRRTLQEGEIAHLVQTMTQALKRPGGTMTLLPIQAVTLWELWENKSLFAAIGVGGGKSLVSLLAGYILGARRPLLFVPAKLVGKTYFEWRESYAKHWCIPNYLKIASYESLSVVSGATMLEEYAPDLIINDECHKFRNFAAARTRRYRRYVEQHPTRQLLMTGSMSKKSIKDYAHFLKWTLGHKAPVPLNREVDEWAEALDVRESNPRDVGALRVFMNREEMAEEDERTGARKAYRRRLVESPGIVTTSDNEIGASLTIQAVEFELDAAVNQAFEMLRPNRAAGTGWVRPDGVELEDSIVAWAVGRQISLGLYRKWDPAAPPEWAAKRKEWAHTCGDILRYNRRDLDSELQIVNAVDAGLYPDAVKALTEWRAIKNTFEPNSVPVWLSTKVLDYCQQWALEAPGIVWCEDVEFAKELAKRSNLAYYGAGDVERATLHAINHSHLSFVASMASINEGANLQTGIPRNGRPFGGFSRNLITSFPPNNLQTEQVLGRTHRQGQEADEVTFEVLCNSSDQLSGFWKSLEQARFAEDTHGQKQKIIYADKLMPTKEEIGQRREHRWWMNK